MESIFNPDDNAAIIRRLQSLTPASERQWGKMNVSQMVAHCQKPIEVAFGQGDLRRNLFGRLFGKMVKNTLLKPGPFSRNSPTAPGFKIEHTPDFEQERDTLIRMVQRFAQGPASISNMTHPFFGTMTAQEWDTLQWKHLDHHLRQFGV